IPSSERSGTGSWSPPTSSRKGMPCSRRPSSFARRTNPPGASPPCAWSTTMGGRATFPSSPIPATSSPSRRGRTSSPPGRTRRRGGALAGAPGRHGTFVDCITRLPEVRRMGFDVLYLPPIHPIGRTGRKGRDNSLVAGPDDPGSPWAIGGPEGGHTAVHPQLGTLEDFRRLVAAAGELDIEIALDLAFQCSPDHPWLREQPDWFYRR